MKTAKPRMPTLSNAVKQVRKNHAALEKALLSPTKTLSPMKIFIILVPNSPQVQTLAPKIKHVISREYQRVGGDFLECFVFTLVDHPEKGRYRGYFKEQHRQCFISAYDDERNAAFVAMAFLSGHCEKIERRATVAQNE